MVLQIKKAKITKKGPDIARIVLAAAVIAFIVVQTCLLINTSSFLLPPEIESAPSVGQAKEGAPAHVREPKPPKKFYAVHIGPSKTGTSSIQANLCRMATLEGKSNTFSPDKDNIIYVGKRIHAYNVYNDPYRHMIINRTIVTNNNETRISVTPAIERKWYLRAIQCMGKIMNKYFESNDEISILNERLETDEETRNVLKEKFLQQCWTGWFRKEEKRIDISYMLNFSIVDSDEMYSYHHTHDKNWLRFWMFDILGYERLLVVGAYRRYADWLVSAYTEKNKPQCMDAYKRGMKVHKSCPQLFNFMNDMLSRRQFLVRSYTPISGTLPACLERGPPNLQAKVLNYFQIPHSSLENTHNVSSYDSITTELYCHAFGEELTPHTCRHALQNSRRKNSTSVFNKGSFSDSLYQQILATAYKHGFLHLSVVDKSCTGEKVWCERVLECSQSKKQCYSETKKMEADLHQITRNGTKTIVRTNSSNIKNFRDLANYHTEVLKQSWTTSLPILCPSNDFLHRFLNKSLALEERAMPEFYRSPLGKEKHVQLFWGKWLQEKKLFCWVDLFRLFEGATSWDEILHERMVNYDWGEPREYVRGETKELVHW